MKLLLRSFISFLTALWVGALLFFPVVAWAAFSTVADTHLAGTVVRLCLRSLHSEGIAAGLAVLVLLLLGGATGAYSPRRILGPVACLLAMLLLTAFSQYGIMPRMETDRLAVGGAIDAVPATEPHHAEFNRLHLASERVESGVLVAGLLLLVFLARAPYGEK